MDKREKLEKKLDKILDKYKGKNWIYSRMKGFAYHFLRYPYINPEWHSELANLTGKMDFGCNFKDGRCKQDYRGEMCCCDSCYRSYGHFRERFFDDHYSERVIENELLYYAVKFNIKTGFWRKNKGCILPRERRSATCVGYNCMNKKTNEEKLLINMLHRNRDLPDYTPRIIKMLKKYFLHRDVK